MPQMLVELRPDNTLAFLPIGSLRKPYTFRFNPAEQVPAGMFLKYLLPYEPEEIRDTPEWLRKRLDKAEAAKRDRASGLRQAATWLESHQPTKAPPRRKSSATLDLDLSDLDL